MSFHFNEIRVKEIVQKMREGNRILLWHMSKAINFQLMNEIIARFKYDTEHYHVYQLH